MKEEVNDFGRIGAFVLRKDVTYMFYVGHSNKDNKTYANLYDFMIKENIDVSMNDLIKELDADFKELCVDSIPLKVTMPSMLYTKKEVDNSLLKSYNFGDKSVDEVVDILKEDWVKRYSKNLEEL